LKQSRPAITVIIPTHNRAEFLKRAIKSVLAQTWQDFELIIVDDASTDDTANVVRDYQDERILYHRHDSNLGAPASRNTGIAKARGDYIALLDDDDELFPRKLEKQMQKYAEVAASVGLIYTGHEVRNSMGKLLHSRLPEGKTRGDVRLRLLLGPAFPSHTPLIRRDCFKLTGGFDDFLTSCQDWDMWKRISEHYEFDYVPEVLSTTYQHDHQISSDFSAMIPGRIRMVEKHWEEFRKHPVIFVIHLKRIGKMHCINGTWREALPWFKEAVKVAPREIFKIVAWCILELPRVKMSSREGKFKRYLLNP